MWSPARGREAHHVGPTALHRVAAGVATPPSLPRALVGRGGIVSICPCSREQRLAQRPSQHSCSSLCWVLDSGTASQSRRNAQCETTPLRRCVGHLLHNAWSLRWETRYGFDTAAAARSAGCRPYCGNIGHRWRGAVGPPTVDRASGAAEHCRLLFSCRCHVGVTMYGGTAC